jgi:glycosyltransferase involved in cell wall biosynthesis
MKFFTPQLSIIIAYHNEGIEFIGDTIQSIIQSIDISYEIIIIDDYSDEPCRVMIPIMTNYLKIIRHTENKGVGAAFDTGVKYARSNNLFLMGCDVRFNKNNWASKMIAEIKKHKNTLICTSVFPLSFHYPEITYEVGKKMLKVDLYRGASILFMIGENGDPHHILEATWLPREFLPLRRPDYVAPTECYEVASILGAAYGTTKKWYRYIDGFWGHRFWGTLEPLISLKCWLMGGRCMVAPQIETIHIFKNHGSTPHADLYTYGKYKSYNRILTSWLLFSVPDKNRLIDWLQDTDFTIEAKKMIDDRLPEIIRKRNEYRKKFKRTIPEIVEKFNLKF